MNMILSMMCCDMIVFEKNCCNARASLNQLVVVQLQVVCFVSQKVQGAVWSRAQ